MSREIINKFQEAKKHYELANQHSLNVEQKLRFGNDCFSFALSLCSDISKKSIEKYVHEKLWKMHGSPPYFQYGKHAFYGEYGRSATPEEKVKLMDDFFLEFPIREFLCTGKYTPVSKKFEWKSLNTGGRQLTDFIEIFKQSLPTEIWNDVTKSYDWKSNRLPTFTMTLPFSSFFSASLELIKHDDSCLYVWRHSRTIFESNRCLSVVSSISVTIEQQQFFQHFFSRKLNAVDQQKFFKFFTFAPELSQNYQLKSVAILKKFPSFLDSTIIVDKDHWTLTLISAGESSPILGLNQFGHAVIVIEGVVNNSYFVRYAHLTYSIGNSPKVRISDSLKTEIKLKTKTWSCSQIQDANVLSDIQKESQESNYQFDPLAQYSSTSVNCLIWAIRKLCLGRINLPPMNTLKKGDETFLSEIRSYFLDYEPNNYIQHLNQSNE